MQNRTWRVSTKLWGGIIGMMLAVALLMALSASYLTGLQDDFDAQREQLDSRVRDVSRWAAMTESNAVRTLALVAATDEAVEASLKADIKQTSDAISAVQKRIEGLPLGADEKEQMQRIAAARTQMVDARATSLKLKSEGNAAEALRVLKERYVPSVGPYLGALHDMVALEDKHILQFREATHAGHDKLMASLAGACLLLFVFMGAAAMWLIRSIREPLEQANNVAARVAAGDLSQVIVAERGDEFGELMRSLATMSEALAAMVRRVRQATDSISTASAEIAAGNQDLSTRTEQTSSNLQSTASAMEQLTGTVQHSADNARQASQLASSASEVAHKGGTVVQEVVATMQEINTSSRKIADIIGVIDSIAFQTNILALNAAVEAARAGEQGRGFAVVASEVRSLAARSAEAAKEIKALINSSVEKVDSGTKLVSNAGETMQEIVQSVCRVADVIGEITAALGEQSSSIGQINGSVSNLDQMTQQNAALVEESAAAAQSLRDQAQQLAQVVGQFQLSGQGEIAAMCRPLRDVTPRPAPLAAAAPAPRLAATRPTPPKAAPAPAPRTLAAPRAAPASSSPPRPAAKPAAPPPAAPAPAQGGGDDGWETF